MGNTEDRDLMTAREMQVLYELIKGYSNKEIADALFIGEKTVKFHLTKIYAKNQVKHRSEMIKKWYSQMAPVKINYEP